MPDYAAGTASIKITPSFRDFVTKVESELRGMDFSIDVRVGADTRVAAAEIANLRRAANGNVTFRVDANTAVAAAELAALRRAAARPVPIPLRPEVDRGATNRATGEVTKTAKQVKQELEKAFSSLKQAGVLNLKVIGVVGAAGAIADLMAITEAAAKASHVIALIPAIGFAGLAGIGSVITGFSGIPAAFKAASAASKDAGDAATKHRDALAGVAEAEFQVEQADHSARASQQSLTDAYKDAGRSIRDMNNDLTDQKLATEDAALSVQEAAQRLAQVQNDPRSDSNARARADLTYREALQRLTEQQTKTKDLSSDTADANIKGVDGSKQVVDAKQRVIEATHAETRAAQELAKAREEAAKPSGSQSKADEAFAKLSPNAKGLVTDVRALGPAWKDAHQAAQDALTAGMGPAVTHLADVQLPGLKAGMVGINTAINTGLRASIAALSSDTNKADFKTSLDNTSRGFANAARGAEPLTNALTKLVTVGSSFLPGFGDAIANAAEKFNNLIQRTAADGSLKKWIQDGIDTTKELARIIGHIGSSIASVFRAAGDDGATLKKLEDLTDHMSKFLKSTEGQEKMKGFFRDARDMFDKIKPVLADIPGLLKGVYDGFKTWSLITLPFLAAAASLLSAHPALVKDIVIAYLAFKTIGPIFSVVNASINAVNQQMSALRNSVGFTTGAMQSGMRVAAGGLASFLTGPFGLALIAASAGLLLLKQRHDDASAAAAAQKQHEEDLQATLDKGTGKVTKETLDAAGKELQQQGFFTRAESFGIDPQTFLRASVGLADSDKTAINAQLTKALTDSLGKDAGYAGITSKNFATAGLSGTDIAKALQGVPEAVQKYADATKKFNDALGSGEQDKALPDLHNLKSELDSVGESAATLGGKMNGYSTEVGSAGEKQRELNQALNGSFQLTDDAKRRFDDLKIAVQAVPDAKTVYIKDTTPEVKAKLTELGYQIDRLPDGTIKITADDARAKADILAVANAPYKANVEVNFQFPQSLSVQTLKKLHESVDNIPIAPGLPKAAGGEISGGTPGKDSVPLLGMPGEHMLTTGDVDKLGGQAGAYRFRAALQQGQVGRYELGGAVGADPASRAKALDEYARSRNGSPYDIPNGDDCSGFISQLANVATGQPPRSGRMSTVNEGPWLTAHGFQTGTGGSGSFRVGWINDPSMAAGGHTAGTLPSGTNVESGGATSSIMYGGQAIGADSPLFIDHAYLAMGAAGTTAGVPGNATTAGTQSTLYPQAPPVGRASDAQLQAQTSKAAVDQANSERNQIYANPAATAQDKLAADTKLQQAQNQLESSQKSDTSAISLQGIFSKAGSIIATGLLSGLGLENSILSESNVYNKSFNALNDRFGPGANLGGGYAYQPQNLPQYATTTTPQSSAGVNDPSLATQIPGSGPITGQPVNPNLGTAGITVSIPGSTTGSGKTGPMIDRVRGIMADLGWHSGAQWNALDQLVEHESGWNPNAQNPTSTAYGLFQFLDDTWASVGGVKTSDAGLQALYGRKYIQQRYGDPVHAWDFWQAQSPHWYDNGGEASGVGIMMKNVIRPERVLNPSNTETFNSALPLLESINASAWSPTRVGAEGFHAAPATAPARGNTGHVTNIEARVADVHDLWALGEREMQKAAIGLSAALP